MFQFLHHLFGGVDNGRYPESLVDEAIERAVDSTDPWLRGVSGYRKRLRPAVVRAIDHVVDLVERLPPPLAAGFAAYEDDPQLRAYFMSTNEMRKVYGGDPSLAEFRRQSGNPPSQVFALLMMQKQEGVTLGAELKGEIVMRDVAQTTVTFEGHRLLDPSGDETMTRRHLMRRAFDHLLGMALGRITSVKSERDDLERRRALLGAKLNLLQRGGMGFDTTAASGEISVASLEKELEKIDSQFNELGGDDEVLDMYLAIAVEILGAPEKQLWASRETLIVDRLGIVRSEPSFDAPELTLNVLRNSAGESLVSTLVALPGDDLRGLAL